MCISVYVLVLSVLLLYLTTNTALFYYYTNYYTNRYLGIIEKIIDDLWRDRTSIMNTVCVCLCMLGGTLYVHIIPIITQSV